MRSPVSHSYFYTFLPSPTTIFYIVSHPPLLSLPFLPSPIWLVPVLWSSSWISLSHLVKTKRKLVGISCVKDGKPMKNMNNKKVIKSNYTVIVTRFFYKQLHFRVQPRSCLAFFQNGFKTRVTPTTNTCLNDYSEWVLSFDAIIFW